MAWIKIENLAQVESIIVGQRLLHYPLMIQVPERLEAITPPGDISRVQEIQSGSFLLDLEHNNNPQKMLQSTFPQTVRIHELIQDRRWFLESNMI